MISSNFRNHHSNAMCWYDSLTTSLKIEIQNLKFLIVLNTMFDVGANIDNPLLQEVLLETMKCQLTT
jgi:hypothetical protein